jgi:hypothetical protein
MKSQLVALEKSDTHDVTSATDFKSILIVAANFSTLPLQSTTSKRRESGKRTERQCSSMVLGQIKRQQIATTG